MMLATIGDNRPPEDVDPLLERLAEQYQKITARAVELLEAESRVPASLTEDTLGRASDYAGQLKACVKLAEDARKSEKQPFLDAGRKVDAWFGDLTNKLQAVVTRVEQRVSAYLRAKEVEERRKREEEARQLREEARQLAKDGDRQQAKEVRAEAAQAIDEARNASAADLVRTHTGLGTVATLKTSWAFEVLDRTKIDLETLRPYLPIDAIEKAIRGYVRAGGRELAGCRIFQDKRASIR